MSFNLRLLDDLSYDEAEPLLEGYIMDAVDAFVASTVGSAYVKSHPEGGGDWISIFIEIGYLFGDRTLSKMTKGDAQQIMEYWLPRKITLLDRSETETAIPELVAFWHFLKQDYKLRSAGAISKYLTSIEGKFTDWMFDPSRGGIAKSFVTQGLAAGYDMQTQAGVEAFQSEYNKGIKAANAQSSGQSPDNNLSIVEGSPLAPDAMPDDVKKMLEMMGVKMPEPGEPINPSAFIGQLVTLSEQINELVDEDEQLFTADDIAEMKALQAEAPDEFIQVGEKISEADKALLTNQSITENEPGTILKDFQTVLEAIGTQGISVSSKRKQFPRKLLATINERLAKPIEIGIQTPQQKSYPPIHGLYLLLRATGIVTITVKGKKHHLSLTPEVYDSWQQLNPTEQYCSLLEAWLVRAHAEMFNEERSGVNTEGDYCLRDWQMFAEQKSRTYAKYAHQDSIRYRPKYHNLALMELFGIVDITSGKPQKGKGWRIKKLDVLPFGDALMRLIRNAYLVSDLFWFSTTDPAAPFNRLQPILQPYFPEWQQTLAVLTPIFSPECHIFKVSLGDIWRRIAISGDSTLESLSALILDSVGFDSDHLDCFTYINQMGRQVRVMHPYMEDGEYFTPEVKIGDLPLVPGSTMEYLFDFGDCWRFNVQLESIDSKASGIDAVIEVHGEAPEQYPEADW